MIVTDGVIHDLLPTIDMIGLSTHCPMSIVIIGVGQDDFALMNKLNSDFEVIFVSLRKKKEFHATQKTQKQSCRKNTQLVAQRDFKSMDE